MTRKLKITAAVLAFLGLTALAGAAVAAPPAVYRPSPFPTYRVGDTAQLYISAGPAEANQPVFQFRLKNGLPDGPQPTQIGFTDGAGNYQSTVYLPPGVEASYSMEQYSVGSPTGPKSQPALSFTIAPQTPLAISCGCEHLSTPYDQFCGASVSNPLAAGDELRYYWTTTPGAYFPFGQNPISPFVYADCIGGGACWLKVTVQVDLLREGYAIDSGSVSCASGTSGQGGRR